VLLLCGGLAGVATYDIYDKVSNHLPVEATFHQRADRPNMIFSKYGEPLVEESTNKNHYIKHI